MKIENLANTAKYSARAGFAASAIFLSSCGILENNTQSIDTRPVASESGIAQNIPESLYQFYPELRNTNLKLKELTSVKNDLEIPTFIFNLTDYKLDEKVASSIYNYFGSIASTNTIVKDAYIAKGQGRSVVFSAWPNIDMRTTVIEPEGTPKPNKAFQANLNNFNAVTTFLNRAAFTFIQTSGKDEVVFKTQREMTTLKFITEACQQNIRIISLDTNNKEASTDESTIMQEVICNSYGLMISSRYLSVPYEEYEKKAKGFETRTFDSNVGQPLIIFPREAYNSLIPSGELFK